MPDVVVSAATQVLAHVPGLARHGSKPRRELPATPSAARFEASLRTCAQAMAYPANQAYLNALHPRDLPPRPWDQAFPGAQRFAPAGEIMPEEEFLGLMAAVDRFDLLALSPDAAKRAAEALRAHPLANRFDLDRVEAAGGDVESVAAEAMALDLITATAAFRSAHTADEALTATCSWTTWPPRRRPPWPCSTF